MNVVLDDVAEQPGALVLWAVAMSGTAFWGLHLLAETSLAGYSRHHHGVLWPMHGLTATLAALTFGAMLRSRRIALEAQASEAEGSPAGRSAFLGWFGTFTNATNLVLIIVEGAYIAALWTRG